MRLQKLFLPLFMLVPFRAVAADCGPQPGSAGNWEPPRKGIVTNAVDALDIARMAWIAVNPVAKTITLDEWRKSWKASLDGNVWEVDQSRRPDTIGGDVIISISRCDGRILNILLTQ